MNASGSFDSMNLLPTPKMETVHFKSFSKPKIWNDLKINRELSFDFKSICWKKSLGKNFFLLFFSKVKSLKSSLEKSSLNRNDFQYRYFSNITPKLFSICPYDLYVNSSSEEKGWNRFHNEGSAEKYVILTHTKVFLRLWCCVGFEKKTK